ncbi:MAG: hypothetical protein H6745_30220 [Deltaproteobacteria bacterium]|nr:hypothetical protein [Deltaproteobacteria bacterium]
MRGALTMSRVVALTAFAVLLGASVAGCTTKTVCSPPTVEKDGVCVAENAVVCGTGTVLQNGVCVPEDQACAPTCSGRECGPDGCGGTCGTCGDDELCGLDGTCRPPTCDPDCSQKQCGSDGCGGRCGECTDPAFPTCDEDTFTCLAACVPDCRHKACGDDGCGGTCGSCDGGETCSAVGSCVPSAWTCDGARYAARDQCDCGCGAPDPDCAFATLATVGCDPLNRCVDGACEPLVPAAWTCPPLAYDDGITCDCGCGIPDPDCADLALTVIGCPGSDRCTGDSATCAACVAACDGRVCGPDGCGGTCGACGPSPVDPTFPLACVDGACVEGCAPTPRACETAVCGDDGCGGSCGTCPGNTACLGGQCVPAPGFSCEGFCKTSAPAGCGCDEACVGHGDCCPDFVALCGCEPSCSGRVCGDDGCGGSCGTCANAATPYCDADGACQATCTPICKPGNECGDDGCGGVCGTCGAGESCSDEGRCVPPTWLCADFYFGEGGVCDCGCGAVDPDCATIGLTSGCPLGAQCDDATGFCDLSFCTASSDCTPPTWCVGHFVAGEARLRGVCLAPDPAGGAQNAPCASDYGCATGLCVGGTCREHCSRDADCATSDSCIGLALVEPLTLAPEGVVAVCDHEAEVGVGCAGQAACAQGETCLALIDPATLQPSYRCGVVPGGPKGELGFCDATPDCAVGLVCAEGRCMRACPAGQADCPQASTCGTAVLHGGASVNASDDVLADVCVPD